MSLRGEVGNLGLLVQAGRAHFRNGSAVLRRNRLVQIALLAVSLAVLFWTGFALLLSLLGVAVAALTAALVLERVFGIHVVDLA